MGCPFGVVVGFFADRKLAGFARNGLYFVSVERTLLRHWYGSADSALPVAPNLCYVRRADPTFNRSLTGLLPEWGWGVSI